MRAPGASTSSSYTSSRALASSPSSSATRERRLSSKSSSPRIACVGDPGDLLLAAGARGEHLDHLALDQGGVDVHHDQPHAAAQQVRGLHGDVDPLVRRLAGEDLAKLLRVGAGDVQVDRGDRVPRHPLDPVDVRTGVGDPTGDRGDRGGLQRGAEHRDVAAPLGSGRVVTGAAVDLDGHAELRGDVVEGVSQRLPVARRADQQAEDERGVGARSARCRAPRRRRTPGSRRPARSRRAGPCRSA